MKGVQKVKKLFFVFSVLFILPVTIYSQCLNHDTVWTKLYDGPGNGADHFFDIKVSSNSGYIFVVGESHSPNSNGSDYITTKYSPEGNIIWTRTYNGSNNSTDIAYAVQVDDSDNVYLTGKTYSGGGAGLDYLTIKYDSSGNMIWHKIYDGTMHNNDIAYSIYVDNEHYVYVTGDASESGNGHDYVTIKYKPNGDTAWVRKYDGGTASDFASKLTVDNSGNVYVTGYSGGGGSAGQDYLTVKYNSNGVQLWTARYNAPANNDDMAAGVGIDNAGNVYVTGKSAGGGGGNFDYVTIKYNSNGIQQWEMRYDGGLNLRDEANGIVVDTAGNCFVTGESRTVLSNDADYTTIKYNTSGVMQWISKYDGPSHGRDVARVIIAGKNGEIYIGGGSEGVGTGDDFLVIRFDPNTGDTCVFNRRSIVGGSSNENIFAMAIDDKRAEIYACGETSGGGANDDGMTVKFQIVSLLNLKEMVEGFYEIPFNRMTISDTVEVQLRNNFAPYNIIETSKTLINRFSLTGTFRFLNAQSGNYYIVHKHRNSIETWSRSGGEPFTFGASMSYDFTNSNTKAFGNNLKLRGSRYCMYSGEVVYDGIIDASDIVLVYNDALIGQDGYVITDLDGDEFVDASDIIITYNNTLGIVEIITP